MDSLRTKQKGVLIMESLRVWSRGPFPRCGLPNNDDEVYSSTRTIPGVTHRRIWEF